MESSGIFRDVPLGAAKHANFVNRAKALLSMSKLVRNGVTYRFDAASRGAAVMSRGGNEWRFVAPDGRFDMASLSGLSTAECLRQMASVCDSSPVPAWDELAVWLSDSDKVSYVNSLLSGTVSVTMGGVTAPLVPAFTAPGEHISGLLNSAADHLDEMESNWMIAAMSGS